MDEWMEVPVSSPPAAKQFTNKKSLVAAGEREDTFQEDVTAANHSLLARARQDDVRVELAVR